LLECIRNSKGKQPVKMAGILDAVGNSIKGTIGKTLSGTRGGSVLARLLGAGLEPGAESPLSQSGAARWAKESGTDQRVKLTLPREAQALRAIYRDSLVLQPLNQQDVYGIIFPLTPTILLNHTASYNPLAATHSNYPAYAYQNSEVQSFTISADFPVQNSQDARYWVATLHFLRSVTKMFFGKSPQAGNPPPVLHLNGYGDYVFKNVPVVVTNFTTELTNTVDYISTSDTVTQIDEASEASYNPNSNLPVTWAPTMSIFTIQLQPIYSRAAMKDFNLQKFINGDRTDSKGFEFI
jgi:hypothetical protein